MATHHPLEDLRTRISGEYTHTHKKRDPEGMRALLFRIPESVRLKPDLPVLP